MTRRLLKAEEASELVEPAGSGPPSSPSVQSRPPMPLAVGRIDTSGRF